MMARYCEVQGIPFPKINLTEEDRKNPKECYVFSDEDPNIPIVVYFPLVNSTFREYKAPGKFSVPHFACLQHSLLCTSPKSFSLLF